MHHKTNLQTICTNKCLKTSFQRRIGSICKTSRNSSTTEYEHLNKNTCGMLFLPSQNSDNFLSYVAVFRSLVITRIGTFMISEAEFVSCRHLKLTYFNDSSLLRISSKWAQLVRAQKWFKICKNARVHRRKTTITSLTTIYMNVEPHSRYSSVTIYSR